MVQQQVLHGMQKVGMAMPGHDIPLMKSRGTDMKANRIIVFSRPRTKIDTVIAKKVMAKTYAVTNHSMSIG